MDSDPLAWQLLLQAVLLVAYALLSAAETAFRAFGANRARRKAEEGGEASGKLLLLSEKLSRSPTGIRVCMAFLGILSAGFLAVMIAPRFSALYGERTAGLFFLPGALTALSLAASALALTLFMQLLCVTVPKRLASRNPERTARALFRFAWACDALFRPFARLLGKAAEKLLNFAGVDLEQEDEQVTEDEIRMLVDEGEEKGAIEEAERDMIENVFEFNNMVAADCMTHRTDMRAVWIGDSPEEIVSLIRETGLSRFPVYDEDLDDIIGTLTTRDFLLNLLNDRKPLKDILRGARFVPESVRADVLFRDMQRNKFHMAVVVDEYGGTSGLVTMEDLLEEIVGNIYDEYDPQAQQDILELGNGRWKVAGSVDIETFNEATGLDLPLGDEYDTIGGLILSQMSAIPEEGSTPETECFGLRFKVESVAERRIEWVEVEKIDA